MPPNHYFRIERCSRDMNPLYENFPVHRTVLTFEQDKDYRTDVHVLQGSPGLHGKDWLGRAGHEKMVDAGTRTPSGVDKQIKEWLKNDSFLHGWSEIEKIAKLVEHPHHLESRQHVDDVSTGSDSQEGVYHEDGKRYHTLRPGQVNSRPWVVLVSHGASRIPAPIPDIKINDVEPDNLETIEEYSVTHSTLAPRG